MDKLKRKVFIIGKNIGDFDSFSAYAGLSGEVGSSVFFLPLSELLKGRANKDLIDNLTSDEIVYLPTTEVKEYYKAEAGEYTGNANENEE